VLDLKVEKYGPSNSYASSLATFDNMASPHNLFVDNAGTLWIADTLNQRVAYFYDAGTLSTGATPDGAIGPTIGSAGIMQQPSGIYVDAKGGVWVTDAQLNRVYYFPNGTATEPSVVLGAMDFTAGCTNKLLHGPFGVYGATNGDVFIADTFNNRVLHFSAAQAQVNMGQAANVFMQTTLNLKLAPSPTSATAGNQPYAVVVDSLGNVAVSDTNNNRVLIYLDGLTKTTNAVAADDVLGQDSFTSSTIGFDATGLSAPQGISVQESSQILWVADSNNFRVLGFRLSSSTSTTTGSSSTTGAAARCTNPLSYMLAALW